MGGIISLLTHPESASISDEKSLEQFDPNASLASELRGKNIHVDMTKSFPHWTSGAINSEYKRLQVECDRVLEM